MSTRSEALAVRLEAGAAALAEFAAGLTAAQWAAPTPKDGRQVGVIIHHVASVYPLEIQLAQVLAAGNAIEGVTWDAVAAMNSGHAADNAAVSVEDTLALLKTNSAAAAAAIRALSDAELDNAAPVSLNGGAPLTCQFFLEDHAVRHSYHHLAKLKAAVAL